MVAVVNYDQPVKNLIAGLDATGHVTHTAYRKTSVTFHHNGGRLSHEGVLEVWKTREASAHFDVDGAGSVAQYVRINEYAWATGNTEGNKSSISIELANATLAPDWQVAEVTWRSGARLAGWIFARVLGTAPTRETVHVHHDWKSTTCAGPFIDSVRDQLFEAVLAAYNEFATGAATPTTNAPAPGSGTPSVPWGSGQDLTTVARQVIHGDWGSGTDRVNRLRTAGYDPQVVQNAVNALLSGAPVQGSTPPAPARKSNEQIADEVLAGAWGNGPERSRRLQVSGYSPTEIQAIVNQKMGGGSGGRTAQLSVNALAQQVIAGQWSSGLERRRRLAVAGYNYDEVQAEVNRLLTR